MSECKPIRQVFQDDWLFFNTFHTLQLPVERPRYEVR